MGLGLLYIENLMEIRFTEFPGLSPGLNLSLIPGLSPEPSPYLISGLIPGTQSSGKHFGQAFGNILIFTITLLTLNISSESFSDQSQEVFLNPVS